jgi:hypothetical protein
MPHPHFNRYHVGAWFRLRHKEEFSWLKVIRVFFPIRMVLPRQATVLLKKGIT